MPASSLHCSDIYHYTTHQRDAIRSISSGPIIEVHPMRQHSLQKLQCAFDCCANMYKDPAPLATCCASFFISGPGCISGMCMHNKGTGWLLVQCRSSIAWLMQTLFSVLAPQSQF